MLIPLGDTDRSRLRSYVTIGIIAACTFMFLFVQSNKQPQALPDTGPGVGKNLGDLVVNAAIPCEVVRGKALTETEYLRTYVEARTTQCSADATGPEAVPGKRIYAAVIVSLFMHAGFFHLLFNMLFIWVFGSKLEGHLGRLPYALLYVASGIFATLGHVLIEWRSAVPLIGASGALAGIMGAFLVLLPNSKIRIFAIVWAPEIRAKYFLAFWFLSQFSVGMKSSSVAWVAHIVGFAFGAWVGWLLKNGKLRQGPTSRYSVT